MHWAGYRRPFGGCPVGGAGGAGFLGEGPWGMRCCQVSWESGKRRQSQSGSGQPATGRSSLTPTSDSRLPILEELEPFSGEGAILIILSKFTFPPSSFPNDYFQKISRKGGKEESPKQARQSSRDGEQHCGLFYSCHCCFRGTGLSPGNVWVTPAFLPIPIFLRRPCALVQLQCHR